MPIFLVLALVGACLPVEWPAPPVEPTRGAALALSGGAVAAALACAAALRAGVTRRLRRDPGARYEVARAYGRGRRALFFVNLGTAAACVAALGWGWLVRTGACVERDGRPVLAPFAELLVPLPYFVTLVGCWLLYYDAERALHAALHHGARPFWSRAGYVLHNARQFALLVLLPLGLVAAQQTFDRFAPETARTDAYRLASLGVVPVALLLVPLLMKPLLGLRPLPPGPTRARLEALAARLHFRCTDFLVWPTHGATANALIAGLLPRVRYVVFTDRLLEDLPPDELDAVLGHEIGHAKHGHIWLYAGFLMLSLATLAALVLLLVQRLDAATDPEWVRVREALEGLGSWLFLPPVALAAGHLFVVFGALSRRCERQADVYGCRAVSCGNPACTGHDAATPLPPGGAAVCPTGARTFARALERVSGGRDPAAGPSGRLARAWRGATEWVLHWMHGPMPGRIAFVLGLVERPAEEARFQRRAFAFKCALMLALAAALVVLGAQVGWRELLDAL